MSIEELEIENTLQAKNGDLLVIENKMVIAGAIIGAVVGGIGGLLTSFTPCICGYLTRGAPWVPVHTFMKVEKQMALIEKSKLSCFLGGTIQIFYNEETASEMADLNMKGMLLDWGSITLTSVIFGASAPSVGVGLSSFFTGAKTAWSLGGNVFGTYMLGTGANVLGGFFAGEAISFGKDILYDHISVGGYSLKDYKVGNNIESLNEKHDSALFELDYGNKTIEQVSEDSDNKVGDLISNITDDIGGVREGKYDDNLGKYTGDGVFWDERFYDALDGPNSHKVYFGNSLKNSFLDGLPIGFKNGDIVINKDSAKSGLMDVGADAYSMIKHAMLAEEIDDVIKTEDEEVAARNAIKVTENDI